MKTIRIAFGNWPPYVNGECSRIPHFRSAWNCKPGVAVEIIALITSYLNLTVDVSVIESNFNCFELVHNNETDLCSILFAEDTPDLQSKFEFTRTIYWEKVQILVKQTDYSFENIFSFFKIYSLNAWLCMVGVFVLFTSFGLLVRYVECQLMFRKSCNFTEILWKMIRLQLVQSEKIDFVLSAGGSSLLVFLLFQICLILGLFQGFILTTIVNKSDSLPITGYDFTGLIKEKKFSLVVEDENDWLLKEVLNSDEFSMTELRQALTFNPYILVKSAMEALGQGNGSARLVNEDFWSRVLSQKYCNVVAIDSAHRPRLRRFVFKKGSDFVSLFNQAIDDNWTLIQFIVRKYTQNTYRPSPQCTIQTNFPAPLAVGPYYGLLILFFVGIISACFAFSGELLI